MIAKPKLSTCKVKDCRVRYERLEPWQDWCSPEHGAILGLERLEKAKLSQERARAKKELVEWLDRKEKAKRPKTLKTEAQAAFNAFIRYRDLSAGHPCICCGSPFEPQKRGGSVDAGHYLSRGTAPHLRFDELNVHAQRKNCNRPGGTTRQAFRDGMIARIGLEAVEALEADQSIKHYRDDDYRAIRDGYRARLRELQNSLTEGS